MKWLKYISLFLCSFLWLLGCSPKLSKYLYDKGWVKDDYRYGDLYRLSNLAQFKQLTGPCQNPSFQVLESVQLVLAGDSFVEKERIPDKDLPFAKIDRVRNDEPSAVVLHPHLKKVLVLEIVERHFRERFTQPWSYLKVVSKKETTNAQSSFWRKLYDYQLPYSAELHESVLFGYDLTLAVKEFKAWLNFHLLDRVDDKVKLSEDQQHLLYALPLNPGISSIFDPVSEIQIVEIIQSLNQTADNYKEMGFDRVILNIIPNKESILGQSLGDYNQIIERIQSHPELEMEIFDMNATMNQMGAEAYLKGDTHWTCQAQATWLSLLYQKLASDLNSQ